MRTARAFVGIASVGFDSDANRIANEAPAWLGGLVYAYGALRALLAWRPARFEIELDPPGRAPQLHAPTRSARPTPRPTAAACAPHRTRCSTTACWRWWCSRPSASSAFLTRILPKVFSGEHVEQPSVHVFRARAVSISCERPFTMYADGDPIGATCRCPCVRCRGAVLVLTPAQDLPTRPSRPARLSAAADDPASGAAAGRPQSRRRAPEDGRHAPSSRSPAPSARSRACAAAAARARPASC